MTDTRNFKSKIVNSAKLSGAQFGSRILLRLVSTIVLTRLLAPETYGVFAVVLMYRFILEMLSDLGLRSVILTKEGDLDAPFMQTCWTVSLARGLAIAAGSGGIALVIAGLQSRGVFAPDNAYSAPDLPLAIFALGCVGIIASAESVNRYEYERKMLFGRVTIGMVLANVAGLLATIAFAYMLRSVWALVLGAALQAIFLVVFSHLAFKGAPMRPGFNRDALRIIIARGKWILSHSFLTASSMSADRLFLGFAMSSSVFGYYFIARQLAEFAAQFLRSLNSQMGLQVFRYVLDAPAEKIRKNYYRYRLFFDMTAGLIAGGFFATASLLVGILYDDRYAGVAPLLQVLCLSILLTGPLLMRDAYSAERKFRTITFMRLISATTLWVGLVITLVIYDWLQGALVLIAFYRLPEALLWMHIGTRRGWVVLWRETLPLVFFVTGYVAGEGVTLLARSLW